MSFEALLIVAAAVLVTGALATIYFYVTLHASVPGESMPSFVRYFAFAVLLAFLAYFVGSAAGIYVACRPANSGNLCGIWGAVGVGPLSAGIALWSYGFWWRRRLGHAASSMEKFL